MKGVSTQTVVKRGMTYQYHRAAIRHDGVEIFLGTFPYNSKGLGEARAAYFRKKEELKAKGKKPQKSKVYLTLEQKREIIRRAAFTSPELLAVEYNVVVPTVTKLIRNGVTPSKTRWKRDLGL